MVPSNFPETYKLLPVFFWQAVATSPATRQRDRMSNRCRKEHRAFAALLHFHQHKVNCRHTIPEFSSVTRPRLSKHPGSISLRTFMCIVFIVIKMDVTSMRVCVHGTLLNCFSINRTMSTRCRVVFAALDILSGRLNYGRLHDRLERIISTE